jgi:tetratricopeptide (TPR) repeat protein
MKKAFLIILAMLVTMSAGAQKKMISAAQDALEKGELDKAWESIQTAKNSVETKDNPKTYFVMGQILQAVCKSSDQKYAAISENPVVDAFNSYQKALDIDPKKRYSSDVSKEFLNPDAVGQNKDLLAIASNKAIAEYEKKSYDKALELFELVLSIEQYTIYKILVDTSIIFNCGLAAVNAKKYDKAIGYLKKVTELKYGGGSSYSWLRGAYMAKGDTVSATATMQKAYEIYPNDLSVLVDLVNFYLTSGQVKEAFAYLNKAEEKDPNNVSFIFAEGTLYEKMNQPDKALEAYTRATKIDPNYFNSYYNIGVMYHNKAKSLYDSANNANDQKYAELSSRAETELRKCIPYLEKAHQIDPKESPTAETLESIYFRLQMDEKLLNLSEEMHQYYPKDETHAKMLKNIYVKLKMDDKLAKLKTEMGW